MHDHQQKLSDMEQRFSEMTFDELVDLFEKARALNGNDVDTSTECDSCAGKNLTIWTRPEMARPVCRERRGRMRRIDADALLAHAVEADRMGAMLVVGKGHILSAPTIDSVEVVRCRDCIYAKPVPAHAAKDFTNKALSCEAQRGDWKRAYGFSVVAVDGYCDEGERKEPDHGRTN